MDKKVPYGGVELVAGKALPTRVAKSTPKRVIEQSKPGPITIIQPESRAMVKEEPEWKRKVDVPMSTPPCLLQPDTEAGKKRLARKEGNREN